MSDLQVMVADSTISQEHVKYINILLLFYFKTFSGYHLFAVELNVLVQYQFQPPGVTQSFEQSCQYRYHILPLKEYSMRCLLYRCSRLYIHKIIYRE